MSPKKINEDSVNKFINLQGFEKEDVLLISPFTLLCVGCTQAGKSSTILSYLREPQKIFNTNFDQIIYLYGSDMQEKFLDPQLKHVNFTKDLNVLQNLEKSENGILLILDDLLSELGSDTLLQNLFTREAHHKNISIVFISQTAFLDSKHWRLIKENTLYFILKMHTNPLKLKALAPQLGIKLEELMTAYKYVTDIDIYNSLFIDKHIRSKLRPISPMRYDLLNGSKLLIPDNDLQYHLRQNKIQHLANDSYIMTPK